MIFSLLNRGKYCKVNTALLLYFALYWGSWLLHPDFEQRLNVHNIQKGFLMINGGMKQWNSHKAVLVEVKKEKKRERDKKLITFQTFLLNNKDEKGRETSLLPFANVVSLDNHFWGCLWGGSPGLGERRSTFTRNTNKCSFFLLECSSPSAHAWAFMITVHRWIIYSGE